SSMFSFHSVVYSSRLIVDLLFFFFFQAEDGIRAFHVTGVQTCALPICRYPTAASAARLGEKRLAAFLVKHSYSGRRPVKELLTRLRSAPAGTTDPVQTIAVRDVVLALVSVIEALNSAGKALDRSVIARLGEHPDAEV